MLTSTFNDSLRGAAAKMGDVARSARHVHDPVLWAEDVLGVVLWSKQKEILYSLAENKRTAVKSCHSIGKTFIASVAACWWVSTRENCMVQSTAPTYEQVHAQLWEEIRKMHTSAGLIGKVNLEDKWRVPMHGPDGRHIETLVGEGKKPADTNIHGFHGTHRPGGVLVEIDEACGVATTLFTGAEAITTARQDRQLATGNPDDPHTEFGRIFDEDSGTWNLITVSVFDTPHYTGEAEELRAQYKDDPIKAALVEILLAGVPQPEWAEERRLDWGEESPRYQSKVLAEFPLTAMDSLFSAAEIEIGRANEIEPNEHAFRVMGVDVARYGNDASVCTLAIEGKVSIVGAYNTMDTMEVAARVHKLAVEHKVDQVRVDAIGIGSGVVDRLVGLAQTASVPYVVVEMTASARAPDRSLHRNSRAYWYDSLKHQLRNGMIDLPDGIKGSHEARLHAELTSIRHSYPNGIMQIESKEDIRKRGDKSPDYVDSLVMAVAPINYLAEDPLASKRVGDVFEINVMDDLALVSPY